MKRSDVPSLDRRHMLAGFAVAALSAVPAGVNAGAPERPSHASTDNEDIAMSSQTAAFVSIAVLKAKPDQREALRDGLLTLIAPTRAEPGNRDYVLFEAREEPGTFYMREAFADDAAIAAHFDTPHFKAFGAKAESLLAEPLRLIRLDQVSN